MNTKATALGLAALLGFATPAALRAQEATDAPVGKQAGTVMVRLAAAGIMPGDSSSSVGIIGGHVRATDQPGPEVDLSYFFTDNLALNLIAASTRHEISVTGSALGNVDIGSTYVLPPTITAQWHFFPHQRLSPYLGVGLNVTFFYDTSANSPLISKFGLATNAGPALNAGIDYNIFGHWFLNFDFKQIFLNADARVHALGLLIKAHDALNPAVISAGVAYRF